DPDRGKRLCRRSGTVHFGTPSRDAGPGSRSAGRGKAGCRAVRGSAACRGHGATDTEYLIPIKPKGFFMLTRSFVAALALSLATPALAQDEAATAEAETEASEAQTVPDIALGAEDAPLTIIEYASFTCGHCANFHEENWPKLKSEYVDTGKVRFIQRDVYFDAVGLWAGILARCGG